MTTTVYDRVNQLVASDSRWSRDLDSLGLQDFILFVDDTGFGKISVNGNYVLCLAGNGSLIESWKSWWKGPNRSRDNYPPVEKQDGSKIVIYAINKATNEMEFWSNLSCVHLEPENQQIQAVFSGSGQTYALQQWQQSQCAKSSVVTAMDGDCYTGGTVRFIDFNTGHNDLEDTVNTIADVVSIIKDRGQIMNKYDPTKTTTQITEPHLKMVRDLIANGDVNLSAPIGNANVVWDANAHQRLSNFIGKVLAEESAATSK